MALVTASKPLRGEKIRWKRRYERLKERKKPPRERPRRKRVKVEFLIPATHLSSYHNNRSRSSSSPGTTHFSLHHQNLAPAPSGPPREFLHPLSTAGSREKPASLPLPTPLPSLAVGNEREGAAASGINGNRCAGLIRLGHFA
jgi:hypothetical protein